MAGYDLVRPCSDCPFRTDRYFHLARGRRDEIAESLRGGAEFHCHKTVDYSDDDDGEGSASTDDASVCAGALITMEKAGDANQMMRIAERLGVYRRDRLDMDAPVPDDLDEWVDTGADA